MAMGGGVLEAAEAAISPPVQALQEQTLLLGPDDLYDLLLCQTHWTRISPGEPVETLHDQMSIGPERLEDQAMPAGMRGPEYA